MTHLLTLHLLTLHLLTLHILTLHLLTPDLLAPRDRAILETFYSTGIRRLELIHLGLYDIDLDRGTLMVRHGKGKRDRMLPIGERAVAWVEKYLNEVRPELATAQSEQALFLTNLGTLFHPNRLTALVRNYINATNIGKKGSCHLFRHSMATHMLENGADIRFIQAMLGHARMDTTQIYTQVSIKKLKEVHTLTHPARMKRVIRGGGKKKPPNPASRLYWIPWNRKGRTGNNNN